MYQLSAIRGIGRVGGCVELFLYLNACRVVSFYEGRGTETFKERFLEILGGFLTKVLGDGGRM